MWKCDNCGEDNEDNFDVCFNCLTQNDNIYSTGENVNILHNNFVESPETRVQISKVGKEIKQKWSKEKNIYRITILITSVICHFGLIVFDVIISGFFWTYLISMWIVYFNYLVSNIDLNPNRAGIIITLIVFFTRLLFYEILLRVSKTSFA